MDLINLVELSYCIFICLIAVRNPTKRTQGEWVVLTLSSAEHSPSCWRRHSSGGSLVHGPHQRVELQGDSASLGSPSPFPFSSGPQSVINFRYIQGESSVKIPRKPHEDIPLLKFSSCFFFLINS